jgi:hypothetical protein
MVRPGKQAQEISVMNSTDTTNTAAKASKAPSHVAYHVREGKNGGKSFWTRIGAAWAHNDGQGFNIQVDCVPLDGRITLRVESEKKE